MTTTALQPDATITQQIDRLRQNLNAAVFGQAQAIDVLIAVLLADGALLIEDVPGVGKTTLAKALARSIDWQFNRAQFTPDLLPADILGSNIYHPVDGAFEFRRGPVFCNLFFGDEINRASPRTQSALLEAMSEKQISIDGATHSLPEPFFVIATQNPIEFQGTYPLPESQLDRFMATLNLGYPDPAVEAEMIAESTYRDSLARLSPVLTAAEVGELQQAAAAVAIEPSLARYLVALVQETRSHERVKLPVSPRGAISLAQAARARALMQSRSFVTPDDIQFMAPFVLPHRILLHPTFSQEKITPADVIHEILQQVKVPT